MFHKLAAKYLPYPQALRAAIEKGDVAVSFDPDGSIGYIIAPACANVDEVREAIGARKRWELQIAATGGALCVTVAVAVGALLFKLTN